MAHVKKYSGLGAVRRHERSTFRIQVIDNFYIKCIFRQKRTK